MKLDLTPYIVASFPLDEPMPAGLTKYQRRRWRIGKRCNFVCQACQLHAPFTKNCNSFWGSHGTIDHKKPRSRGGTNKLDNLTWLCATCNRKKADRG